MDSVSLTIKILSNEEIIRRIRNEMWYMLPHQKDGRVLRGEFCGRCREPCKHGVSSPIFSGGCYCQAEIDRLSEEMMRYTRQYLEEVRRKNEEVVEKGIAEALERYFPTEKPEASSHTY